MDSRYQHWGLPWPPFCPNPNTFWFKPKIVPNSYISWTEQEHIYTVLTWWQITRGIFCSPFTIVCFLACKTSSSRIPIAQDTAGKMLISHVGEWWHVKQAEDFWHMVHIWGICHECLDHTACSYRESLTAVYGVEQTNPPHYTLQVMHATGLVLF